MFLILRRHQILPIKTGCQSIILILIPFSMVSSNRTLFSFSWLTVNHRVCCCCCCCWLLLMLLLLLLVLLVLLLLPPLLLLLLLLLVMLQLPLLLLLQRAGREGPLREGLWATVGTLR